MGGTEEGAVRRLGLTERESHNRESYEGVVGCTVSLGVFGGVAVEIGISLVGICSLCGELGRVRAAVVMLWLISSSELVTSMVGVLL
jgi:hypothetical protein